MRQTTSDWDDAGEGRGGGVFRARPGVKAVAAARLVEVGAAAAEPGVPACVAGVLFARLQAGDGGVPAAVEGVPIPEALLLLLKGLLLLLAVLGLLLVVVGPAGDKEKKLLMSVFVSGGGNVGTSSKQRGHFEYQTLSSHASIWWGGGGLQGVRQRNYVLVDLIQAEEGL